MRLNCPHCESLLSAEIDFEKKKQAYVRCAKCDGIAVIHRSAAIADRTSDEFTLENILVMPQATQHRFSEVPREIAATPIMMTPPATPPKPASVTIVAAASVLVATPPPFAMPLTMMEIPDLDTDFDSPTILLNQPSPVTAKPPAFTHAKPPAFLLKKNTMAMQSFAEIEPVLEKAAKAPTSMKKSNQASSSLAVWLAAAIALASGVYLFVEGKKALGPSAQGTAETTSVSVPSSPEMLSTNLTASE